ncbi:MAG: hypothetical protein JXA89_28405 [Anaerolineae bacterium]|nr:hypothetical protein [Anaerolineae bacterium]
MTKENARESDRREGPSFPHDNDLGKLFKPAVDEFYALRGWETETGWPTRERLDELGMEDAYEPTIEGALRTREQSKQIVV